jgi:hypothetical protein
MVTTPMRTRHDQFCKQMFRTGLETSGPIETDAEVRFVRDPTRGPMPDPAKQTTDDQELLMDTQDIVETWRREAIEEGIKQGVVQGREEGFAHSLVEVYQARFGAMPEDLRAVVEDTDDEPTLIAWLRLASTRSADEIAAAIRSFRPS